MLMSRGERGMLLLGPGAYSLDSYLFGRREIVMPRCVAGTLKRDTQPVTVTGDSHRAVEVAVSAYDRRQAISFSDRLSHLSVMPISHAQTSRALSTVTVPGTLNVTVPVECPAMTVFAIAPPVEPMLAKAADRLPTGDGFLYEPKWDGFRAIVFRGATDVYIQSRDLRPLDRYFPELHDIFRERLPAGCVLDGEIVIATPQRARLRRPAAAAAPGGVARREARRGDARRLRRLRPAGRRRQSIYALAPQSERRARLEALLGATSRRRST